jgi:hypothetical protein
MSGIADVWINFMNKKEGEWFDQNLRRNITGTIYYYEVLHKGSGVYLVSVMMSEEEGKAVVSTTLTDENSTVQDQLKRHSIVFNRSKNEGSYYHPLSHSYTEGGRLRYTRVTNEADVPEQIRQNFTIDKYENVSPKNATKAFQGKLVVEVPKDKPDKMVLLYTLEKILPAFNSEDERPMPVSPAPKPESPNPSEIS